MNWKNIAARAAWTFVQAALATFVAVEVAFTVESVKSALVAAVVAGGSAVLSFIKTVIQEQLVGTTSVTVEA
jgi:hypothetical protein